MNLNRKINTIGMSREDWLRERRKGIGGSDAGAILGFNPHRGPFAVFMDKVYGVSEDLESVEAVYWGSVLENVVAKEFEKRTGKKVLNVNAVLVHEKYDFMFANIDRRVAHENAILECKTASQYKSSEWEGDEVPESYICQCMHYMAVTGAEKCYIACLIGGQRFVYKELQRDDEFIEYLTERERVFWEDHVLTLTPPEPDSLPATRAALDGGFHEVEGQSIPLDSATEELCAKRVMLKAEESALKAEIEGIDNKIKLYMACSVYGYGSKYKVSWSAGPKGKTRRFTIRKIKEEN